MNRDITSIRDTKMEDATQTDNFDDSESTSKDNNNGDDK